MSKSTNEILKDIAVVLGGTVTEKDNDTNELLSIIKNNISAGGSSGGGSKLYEHNLKFNFDFVILENEDEFIQDLHVKIINGNANPFTSESLAKYLSDIDIAENTDVDLLTCHYYPPSSFNKKIPDGILDAVIRKINNGGSTSYSVYFDHYQGSSSHTFKYKTGFKTLTYNEELKSAPALDEMNISSVSDFVIEL